jgi:cell division septum initiation protein DivIVA
MSQDPLVTSVSSATPLSPDEIARKSFASARRGVDGEAVRLFLAKVAGELRGALEREAILRERLAEADRRADDPVLDEATLTRAIGIETAKILWTAHDAAGKVVAKAEERAAELLAEAGQVLGEKQAAAEAEALEIRTAAEREAAEHLSLAKAEADSMTEVAHAEAVELFDATKEECRRMVAEARALRNRALADLVSRRRALRVQLEELRTGKDSLLGVVDAVGAAVVELRERLALAEDEARVAAGQAGERVETEQGHGDLAELEEELAAAASGGGAQIFSGDDEGAGASAVAQGESAGVTGAGRAPEGDGSVASRQSVDELFARIRASRAAEEVALVAAAVGPSAAGIEAAVEPAEVAPEARGDDEAAMVSSPRPGELGQVVEPPTALAEQVPEPAGNVADPAATEVTGVAAEKPVADAITEPDVESLARRDHLLGSITAKLGRSLKRALQDDQNDLLDALRQSSRKPVLDELVPAEVQRERFVAAATDQLSKAYEAGAAFLVTGDAVEGPSVSAPAPSAAVAFEAGAFIAAELADDLSTLLRQRIEESLSELDGSLEGSADAAGVAYREWKGSRVEGLAGDFTTRAFATGELAVLSSLSNGEAPLLRWAVEDDDAGGSCPDCDDNSLAGPQPPGAAFPTGHAHPPVHPGCRCLLVPVRS